MAATASTIETPSGKNAAYENFPVGSFLIARRLRPHVALFYAFARAIDDIADNPKLAPKDKIARLTRFEDAIIGRSRDAPGLEKADRLRRSLIETGVPARHCLDLIAAFKQDAVKSRYRDWDDLMAYCSLSASPVGRYLLDLHRESRTAYPASDALCNALQVINHLQDCADDYCDLDRVYLPLDWLEREGASVADLAAPRSSPALRRVIDRALDGVAGLLDLARTLPGRLSSRRLAMESAVIVEIAARLAAELRARDPLPRRVVLRPAAFLACGARGVWAVIAGPPAAT